jgi:hypothetical protein
MPRWPAISDSRNLYSNSSVSGMAGSFTSGLTSFSSTLAFSDFETGCDWSDSLTGSAVAASGCDPHPTRIRAAIKGNKARRSMIKLQPAGLNNCDKSNPTL